MNTVGCDIIKFATPVELARSGTPKFIFVGMPSYHKGFDLLAASYARLLAHYHDAELHVVGDPAVARRMMTDSRVQIHGKLSHGKLSKLLARMDCLVLPSRLDSFGMVSIEALAAGVPVIVSDHVGASQAIRENENGWVLPSGDGAALLDRMLACCLEID